MDRFSVVVNCSGALQDGPEDDLEATHHHAVSALATACAASDILLIQISAVGARLDATTPFLSSKARGDAAIKESGVRYHIFRPGLVLASNAYGGTAMLHMLAAFPWVQPIASPEAAIQTVALDDVAGAVAAAIAGDTPIGFEGDLVETQAHSLRDVVAAVRHWLGFQPASLELKLPDFAMTAISKIADALSRLGWQSPLRSTSVRVLTEGVRGEPADLTIFGLSSPSSLYQTLSNIPAGAQARLFARMALLMPLILVCLSLFWLTSGIVGLARVNEAAVVLEDVGWSTGMAVASVVFWSLVDMAIGVAFLIRRYVRRACWTAVAVSLFYLLAATIAVPALWLDPLGPLIKVVPSILLALVARAALDTR